MHPSLASCEFVIKKIHTLSCAVNELPLHSAKCTAWCAMSSKGLIRPIWFQDEDSGETILVNQVRYRQTISRFKEILDGRTDLQFGRQWLMQDGATPHTTNEFMRSLKDYFGRRIILKKSDFSWAPGSPNLNPLDFSFGDITRKMYTEITRNASMT